MKEFFTDYNEMVLKPSMAWLKKHWKGYLLMTAAIGAAEIAWFCRDDIKDALEEKFHKNEEEES